MHDFKYLFFFVLSFPVLSLCIDGNSRNLPIRAHLRSPRSPQDDQPAYNEDPPKRQSAYDVNPPKRQSAYDINPPTRQSAYDVNPPTRQSAYDINPPKRQSAYDVNPPTRQSAYDVNPPTRQSAYDVNPPTRQSAYDINPPKRQSAYDVNPPTRQSAYDVNPPKRQSAYDVDPPKRQSAYDVDPPKRQSAYDVNPPNRQSAYNVDPPKRQSAYDVNPPNRQSAYNVDPPKRQSAYDVNPPNRQSAYDVNTPKKSEPAHNVDPLRSQSSVPTVSPKFGGSVPKTDVPKNTVNAYWVEPVRSNADKSNDNKTQTNNQIKPVPNRAESAYWVDPVNRDAFKPRNASNGVQPSIEKDNASNNGVNVQPAEPRKEIEALPNTEFDGEPRCILPALPDHGSYTKAPKPTIKDGNEIVTINVKCDTGYNLHGVATVHCYHGFWTDTMPKCLPVTCHLKKHHSVEYRCLVSGDVEGSRECRAVEPVGTSVRPQCRKPLYYSYTDLPLMHCGGDGEWDYVAKCTPECGTVIADGRGLVVGGSDAKRGELPWHVGIYSKGFTPYKQICGGTLISNQLIISAAHCFWDDVAKKLPASEFAVAVGKLHRPWTHPRDDPQISDVKDIHIPPHFHGAASNYQHDIAVVVPTRAFTYNDIVRPVCLSFDSHFDRLQLQTTNKGKVAGWGLTSADGMGSPILQVLELPYVEVGTCIEHSPPTFTAHITGDKICAGTLDSSSALCRGDSGGGLSFRAVDRDTSRYYLRGVVSTAPRDEHACNLATYTSFTRLHSHQDFITQFITAA